VRTERRSRLRYARRVALAALASLVLIAAISGMLASWLGAEPVRRLLERRANERLRGYQVQIGRVNLRPFAFGFDVLELVVARDGHLDLPVAQLTELSARIDGRALARGALVADVDLERPIVYVDRRQAQREARDEIPVHERGWQDALRALVPLEINRIRVRNGEATYLDDGPFEPLRLTEIQGEAANIRNIASRDREYPSKLSLEARVFEDGRLRVRGYADFLAEPLAGVRAEVELDGVALGYFQPILARHHFDVKSGVLALSGEAELASRVRRLRLHELRVHGLVGDYVRTEASAAREPVAVRKALRAAREAAQRPHLSLRADRVELSDANVGLRSGTESRAYRVFLSQLALELDNFSNRFSEGTGHARLRGRFMGSGATDGTATFQPERSGPEFDLEVRIVDTELPALNELLRAHGRFDVAAGLFSLYSEIHVEDGRTSGYVKPLFRGLEVHDPAQDRRDGPVREAYEQLVGGITELLENRAREEVATQTDVSGPLEDPDLDTFELVVRLVENAFVRSILPGFDREAGQRSKHRPPL
jgi:hypothetical protein